MSGESRKFLENKRTEAEFQPLAQDIYELDRGIEDVLAKFRPQDNRTLQLEMLALDEYIIYDYPDQHEFSNWDEDQNGAKYYLLRKLRQLGLEGGETTVQEVCHVAEAMLHNYRILNIDLQTSHAGVRRPQCHVPLGINKALRDVLGEL